MAEQGWLRNRNKIILYLGAVAVLLLILGAGIYRYFGSNGVTVLELAVSAVLTAALVILYFRQTSILKSQRDLLTQELNREARQQHTETLRERVRIWHGNPDKETSENPLEGPDLNIPSISGSSFKSASIGQYALSFPEEEPFRVIPDRILGDRYLRDLLENHASDLKKKKEEIEQLHERFVSLRNEFKTQYDDDIVIHKEKYTLEPEDYLARWIFDLIVLKERGNLEDFSDLVDRALLELERGETSLHREEPRIWIRVEIGGERYIPIYSANVTDDAPDREQLQELRQPTQEDAEEAVLQVLENIDNEHPYDRAIEAAVVLDNAAQAIIELERILIEYEGRPIYPGDCKYLEEARI